VLTAFADYNEKGMLFIQSGNRIVYQKNYGVKSEKSTKVFDEYTSFNAGSFKHVLLAYGILSLQNQGKLAITDTVSHFLPNSNTILRKITLYQLMMHVSGLDDKVINNTMKSCKENNLACFLKSIQTTITEPGTGYAYSNAGMLLLQQIIENVTGKKWNHYVLETILQPGGLIYSKFQETKNIFGMPDAEWQTCLNDLRKFYNAVNEQLFLSPELISQSYQLQVPANWALPYPPPHAFCWNVKAEYSSTSVYFHESNNFSMYIFPDKELVVWNIHFSDQQVVNSTFILKALREAGFIQ
jgi:CubicO group peptidase (beta-lactamase class C family)